MSLVAIMITTKNRHDELRRTLDRINSLDPVPDEILVTADGCTDATIELVRNHDLTIKLLMNEPSIGSVASRAAMMQQTKADLVLALDDDSYPEQTDCIEKLKQLFDENPQLAIATFPQRTDEYPETLQQKDFGVVHPIRSFPNSGACLRVSAYRELPGFEPMFFHMYEEPDYALQCIANDWDVIMFPAVTIRHHWTSQQRSQVRNHHRHARNEFWSTVMRCPFPQMIFICGYRVVSQLIFSMQYGGFTWLIKEPQWWIQALVGLPGAMKRRSPVSWAGYQKWLRNPDQ